MDYCVYKLIDPTTQVIKYIGMTTNPEQRLKEHVSCSDKSNPKKNKWITELKQQNLAPIMDIIESDLNTKYEALVREQHWIKFYLDSGCDLYNIMVNEPLAPINPDVIQFILSCPWIELAPPISSNVWRQQIYELLPQARAALESLATIEQPSHQWEVIQMLIKHKDLTASPQYIQFEPEITYIASHRPYYIRGKS